MTDREAEIAKAESLLDALIDADPDRAERFIEARLARLALHKRLTDRKAALASERAKQAEPVGVFCFEDSISGFSQMDWNGEPPKKGTPLYAAPPAVQAEPHPYPEGDVVGPCICGSWPGGPCLKCKWIPAHPADDEAVRLLRDVTDHWLESGPMKIAIDRYLARVKPNG